VLCSALGVMSILLCRGNGLPVQDVGLHPGEGQKMVAYRIVDFGLWTLRCLECAEALPLGRVSDCGAIMLRALLHKLSNRRCQAVVSVHIVEGFPCSTSAKSWFLGMLEPRGYYFYKYLTPPIIIIANNIASKARLCLVWERFYG